jgi:hypothetical protein
MDDATPAPPLHFRHLQDAQEAGMVAVRRAATDPKTSLQVLEAVCRWCRMNSSKTDCDFRQLCSLRVQYLRKGLAPPTKYVEKRVNTTIVFHGVVPGRELRFHLEKRGRVTEIELPPCWCSASRLNHDAFTVRQWRKVLPYLASVSADQHAVWRHVASAVSRAAVRQDVLLTLLTAKDTTPVSARAALVVFMRKPGMLFRDSLIWCQGSVWQHCARDGCAPAMFWLMITADAPKKTCRPGNAYVETAQCVSVAIMVLAGVSIFGGYYRNVAEVERISAAWPAFGMDVNSFLHLRIAVNHERSARWGAGRAAWASGAAVCCKLL